MILKKREMSRQEEHEANRSFFGAAQRCAAKSSCAGNERVNILSNLYGLVSNKKISCDSALLIPEGFYNLHPLLASVGMGSTTG